MHARVLKWRARDYVTRAKRKRGYRRGYPVALLVGFEEHHAVLWQVFSNVTKQLLTLKIAGRRTDQKTMYNFHEAVIDALRPVLGEGVRSVIVTAPMKTTYAADFMSHVRIHHAYLLQSKRQNRATFTELAGSADQPHNVAELVKTTRFRRLVAQTTAGEADHIVDALNERLFSVNSASMVLYTLGEIENRIYGTRGQSNLDTGYLILTDEYLTVSSEKDRVHRLLQIAKNKNVRTRIVNAETPAGHRIGQLGGIVLFTASTTQR
jgi:stalled ribosome rescue protein Dom34